MFIHQETIICKSRSDRVEIFPFYDMHVGKRNCAEVAIKKQVSEIIKRGKMPNRHVRAILGGDQMNSISPTDVRRFDFHELADWLVAGNAEETRERLSNLANQEINRVEELFQPIQPVIIGALEGNHEKKMRTSQNVAVHNALCDRLQIQNLTDEAIIRLTFRVVKSKLVQVVKLYLRHGYGSGRTAGAEPCKLDRMVNEWEGMDVCLSGHSHSFGILPPKPVPYIPNKGQLPRDPFYRYRFAANPGCWLFSHSAGQSTYESMACYPARPMMTLKIVIWPFWSTTRDGKCFQRPKIELRSYSIL